MDRIMSPCGGQVKARKQQQRFKLKALLSCPFHNQSLNETGRCFQARVELFCTPAPPCLVHVHDGGVEVEHHRRLNLIVKSVFGYHIRVIWVIISIKLDTVWVVNVVIWVVIIKP